MLFVDLVRPQFDPKQVLLIRHVPHERKLRKVLPWLAAEHPDLFNAFQQTQSTDLEAIMHRLVGKGHIASFIGQSPERATFVGLYSINGVAKTLSYEEYWQEQSHQMLKGHGMQGMGEDRLNSTVLLFDLQLVKDFIPQWKGKLVIRWPKQARPFYRRAHRNTEHFPIHAIHGESRLDPPLKRWDTLDLSWAELAVLPSNLRVKLNEWRGVYYIFDTKQNKGYVGSAYGDNPEDGNILHRWMNYAAAWHGGNKHLHECKPDSLRFTILQPMALNASKDEVIAAEASWKLRLHTHHPHGLNGN